MPKEQTIKPGQLYRNKDTGQAFKVLEVRPELEQVKILYLDNIERERLVDTRGRSEAKLIGTIKRKLAEGCLVQVSDDPYSDLWL